VLDVVLAAALLVVTAPLLALAALAIRLESRGPVFYRQLRVGRDGRPFELWKLRTMVPGAEAMGAGIYVLEGDSRITRVGAVLRRYSLDELPQLINIVRGDMSLVGPRPPLPSEVDRYGFDMHRRFLVKPGLTGLWQISGRSDLSWDESVRLDLYYVDNWSMIQDIVILVRTVGAVLSSRGAY
jgi:lipopolysaccharide/colanic/teichoic acid biosynthesis glycosyltransferase